MFAHLKIIIASRLLKVTPPLMEVRLNINNVSFNITQAFENTKLLYFYKNY